MGSERPIQRRNVIKGGITLGGAIGLQAYAPGMASAGTGPRPGIVPLRLTPDQLIDVKACIRPLRAAGPNLAAEQVGDTLVIHNYGHGGSGWSLSWGSADIALGKAMSVLPQEVAVIGCGIIGLTSAVMAQRAGLKVTIYARDTLTRTRSFRAEGSFMPDSRIALTAPAGKDFPALWEQMSRFSWKAFRPYLGMAGKPVEFGDYYILSDTPFSEHSAAPPIGGDSYANTGLPQHNSEFFHGADLLKDIMPQAQVLTPAENPFPTRFALRTSQMHFNFSSYGQALQQEFFERGGRFEMRELHSPGEVNTLREKVVIHATGYAARDLWLDKTVIPVKGQTGWLPPQPEANYGVYYKSGSILSKADGVCVMKWDNDIGDMQEIGNSMELPNRDEALGAMADVASLFAKMPVRG